MGKIKNDFNGIFLNFGLAELKTKINHMIGKKKKKKCNFFFFFFWFEVYEVETRKL